MTGGGLNGPALGAIAAGAVFTYAGVKGYSVPATIQQLVTGKSPAGQQQANAIGTPVETGAAAATLGAGGATSSSIANDALRYVGHAYLFGGAPGAAGTAPWDCSSFCNWVLGHDFGMKLPGESAAGYDGATHGPDTLLYLGWTQASTVGHTAAAAEAGDLCVWQTHMGIALGGGQLVSALNPSLGTKQTSIDDAAPGAELLFVRRILGAPAAGPQAGPQPGKSQLVGQ